MSHLGVELTSEQIEHVAVRAAELRDAVLESACDGALQGNAVDRDTVRGFVDRDVDLQTWLARGFALGYRKRSP